MENMINSLRNREIQYIEIKKEEFLPFRELLIKQHDFKHFRGVAQQGGNIVFTYLDVPRT